MFKKIIKSHNCYWKDLWDLQDYSNKFLRKHWKGYFVMSVVGGLAIGTMTYVVLEGVDNIKYTNKYLKS